MEDQRTFVATLDFDPRVLMKKDEKTYYVPMRHTWKDGAVVKYPKGVPERGQVVVVIMGYDQRNKYHHFVRGMPLFCGRGMPAGKNAPPYGIRPMVRIVPIEPREEPRYRLIFARWNTRRTCRGGRSSGDLVDSDDGKVIHRVTGASLSATGNHGEIHQFAIVEGRPEKHVLHIANNTCNVHKYSEPV